MNNVEWIKLMGEQKSNKDKYAKRKDKEQGIHTYTMSDWEKESEYYINTYYWDIGKGKFIK